VCVCVHIAEMVGGEDGDFLRLKNELVTAFQTQTSLRQVFTMHFHSAPYIPPSHGVRPLTLDPLALETSHRPCAAT